MRFSLLGVTKVRKQAFSEIGIMYNKMAITQNGLVLSEALQVSGVLSAVQETDVHHVHAAVDYSVHSSQHQIIASKTGVTNHLCEY